MRSGAALSVFNLIDLADDFPVIAILYEAEHGGCALATFEQLNQYFTICNMPVAPSQYWNSAHGWTPEDVMKDEEGLQTMRVLGDNMAWMLKALADSPHPEYEERLRTNFI